MYRVPDPPLDRHPAGGARVPPHCACALRRQSVSVAEDRCSGPVGTPRRETATAAVERGSSHGGRVLGCFRRKAAAGWAASAAPAVGVRGRRVPGGLRDGGGALPGDADRGRDLVRRVRASAGPGPGGWRGGPPGGRARRRARRARAAGSASAGSAAGSPYSPYSAASAPSPVRTFRSGGADPADRGEGFAESGRNPSGSTGAVTCGASPRRPGDPGPPGRRSVDVGVDVPAAVPASPDRRPREVSAAGTGRVPTA